MGRKKLGSAAIDLVAGFFGAGLVILATDAAKVDLRVYLLASVAIFFALGLWRAGSEGLSLWQRVLLISLVSLILGVQQLARHWPPDWRGLSYIALFPIVQCVSAGAGLKLRRRSRTTARQLWLALGGAVALAGVVGALTMPAYSRMRIDIIEAAVNQLDVALRGFSAAVFGGHWCFFLRYTLAKKPLDTAKKLWYTIYQQSLA